MEIGVCNGFLTREKRPEKDEVETADLYSYELPQYYGREISQVCGIPSLGANPVHNCFEDNRRFVVLWTDEGNIVAMAPEKIGPILPAYKKDDGTIVSLEGNTLKYFFRPIVTDSEEEGLVKPIGLWYTNMPLKRTPTVNIEDAWDIAMMTRYHPKLSESDPSGFFVRGYAPEEKKMLVERIIREELVGTSREFARIAEGAFIAVYNLHDYLIYEKGRLVASGLESDTPSLFGGPDKFLDIFVSWIEEQFPHVEVCCDDVFVVLVSDRKIEV